MLPVEKKVRGRPSLVPVEGISLSFDTIEKLLYISREQLRSLLLYCSVGMEPPELCGVAGLFNVPCGCFPAIRLVHDHALFW
jgi:hypothetical protein